MSLTVMSPRSVPFSSTTGSFSIRGFPRIASASSSDVPSGAVTGFFDGLASCSGRSRFRSNWRSRLVMIPTSCPSRFTMGTPEILNRLISATPSRSVPSGESVIGLSIIPLSDRLTRSTSAAWRSIDMFLWMTPIPPARAIAIAISDSVTVSIAADAKGTLRGIPRVNSEVVLTSLGCTSECLGVRRTSSKVRTISARTLGALVSGGVDPLMRESPPPAFAGVAGLLDGRVVVAIAKCMALCGLRPEGSPRGRCGVRSDRRSWESEAELQIVPESAHGQTADRTEQSKDHEKWKPAHQRRGAGVTGYQKSERERKAVNRSTLEGFTPVAPRAECDRNQPPGNETVPVEEDVLRAGRSDDYTDNESDNDLEHESSP